MSNRIVFAVLAYAVLGLAQTPTQAINYTRPTYVFSGAGFDQLHGWHAVESAIVPIQDQAGVYAAGIVDLVPVSRVDSATRKHAWTASGQFRAEIFKTIAPYTAKTRWQVLLGGGLGFWVNGQPTIQGDSGAIPSITGLFVYQVTPHFAACIGVRAIHIPAAGLQPGWWNPVPAIGVNITVP